jgi:hypothetical protein
MPVVTISSVGSVDQPRYDENGGFGLGWRVDVAAFLSYDNTSHKVVRWYTTAIRQALLSGQIDGVTSVALVREAFDDLPGDEETRGVSAGAGQFTLYVDDVYDPEVVPIDPPDGGTTPGLNTVTQVAVDVQDDGIPLVVPDPDDA